MTERHHKSWQSTLLPHSATLRDAIRNLNASALQIALVVDSNGALLGTITDGDIRRGLLRGLDMQTPVQEIMFSNPIVAPPEMDREMVIHLMRVNQLLQLPVVDQQRRVLGLHLWNRILTPLPRGNTMVIMAGGMGTRLRPHTDTCPKPMLPVAGKPMLEHIIVRARNQGFTHFVLAIRYLGHMISEYFGDGSKWAVNISYLQETLPLGTAGALALMHDIPDTPIVVTNGDVLTDIHYGEIIDFHLNHNATATMAVRLHEWQHPFGVVQTDGVHITGFEEKPTLRYLVNAGIYVLSPEALRLIEPGKPCHMPEVFDALREHGQCTIVYPMHEIWMDVGRPDDLERAQNEVPQSSGPDA